MAGGIDWFRWHHGSVTDPKFQLVARKAGVSLPVVLAVWAYVLETASENMGGLASFQADECDTLMGLESGVSRSIYAALEARGLIVRARVANPRRYFPSPTMRPSGGVWGAIRSAIFKRDDFTCQYCGARGGRLECDHIKPVADGGDHTEGNLVTACFACNRRKASRSVEEFLRDR